MDLPIGISHKETALVFYTQCFLCTLIEEVKLSDVSGQSMHKPLPVWFPSWSFSSLQPHSVGGDEHNDTLVLFVGLHKFSALLVQ